MLSTPTILTLFPGVTLSVRYLSQLRRNVLGISPVGISSGASCNLRLYWSTYSHLSVTTVYVSNWHFCLSSPGFLALSQVRGTEIPPKPWETESSFWWPQFLHWTVTFEALIAVLLALVIIPGTTMSYPIKLLCRSLSILGFSSLDSWT
jgi:hypothetical protein